MGGENSIRGARRLAARKAQLLENLKALFGVECRYQDHIGELREKIGRLTIETMGNQALWARGATICPSSSSSAWT